MEKIGVFIPVYGSREVAIAYSLANSPNYSVELYFADRQKNPSAIELAKRTGGQHAPIGLNVQDILNFLSEYKSRITFGLSPNEGPIINGLRDMVEREKLGIPMLFPTLQYASEGSKVEQRLLFDKVIPEVNPRFKVYNPKDYEDPEKLLSDIKSWVRELGGVENSVVKPDKPGFGKGVGVGGEHFRTLEELQKYTIELFGEEKKERVIIEEKVEGEESSSQAWCDGNRLEFLPETRDYKRAFDGDFGPNTGGMGSYKDRKLWLPFMTEADYRKEIVLITKLFNHLKGDGRNTGLLGMPFYIAVMHTKDGIKFLEINNREGDSEIINILLTLKTDLAEIFLGMRDGKIPKIEYENKAAVTIYAVPMTYGGYRKTFTGDRRVDLTEAYKLANKYGNNVGIFLGSMDLGNDGKMYVKTSRGIAVSAKADDIQKAREIDIEILQAIDGPLWNRWEISSEEHIGKSIVHMKKLRG